MGQAGALKPAHPERPVPKQKTYNQENLTQARIEGEWRRLGKQLTPTNENVLTEAATLLLVKQKQSIRKARTRQAAKDLMRNLVKDQYRQMGAKPPKGNGYRDPEQPKPLTEKQITKRMRFTSRDLVELDRIIQHSNSPGAKVAALKLKAQFTMAMPKAEGEGSGGVQVVVNTLRTGEYRPDGETTSFTVSVPEQQRLQRGDEDDDAEQV